MFQKTNFLGNGTNVLNKIKKVMSEENILPEAKSTDSQKVKNLEKKDNKTALEEAKMSTIPSFSHCHIPSAIH